MHWNVLIGWFYCRGLCRKWRHPLPRRGLTAAVRQGAASAHAAFSTTSHHCGRSREDGNGGAAGRHASPAPTHTHRLTRAHTPGARNQEPGARRRLSCERGTLPREDVYQRRAARAHPTGTTFDCCSVIFFPSTAPSPWEPGLRVVREDGAASPCPRPVCARRCPAARERWAPSGCRSERLSPAAQVTKRIDEFGGREECGFILFECEQPAVGARWTRLGVHCNRCRTPYFVFEDHLFEWFKQVL